VASVRSCRSGWGDRLSASCEDAMSMLGRRSQGTHSERLGFV
jgi:hypothetical protein